MDYKNLRLDPEAISVSIDGLRIHVFPEDKNIVDLARRSKIGIPAPCYLAKMKYGCCSACVVEVDGELKYACCTPPEDGMKITTKREDLKALRKERLLKYREAIKNGHPLPCSCSC